MRRRSAVVGVVLLGAYLVVLAVTVGLRSDHVRPLYDGFAPPPPYQWVDPPSFFASGNVTPESVTATVALSRDGSVPAGIATPDGQFALNLGRGAIAPSSGASSVTVKITPVAPDDLGPLPARSGLRPNGNAYLVSMRYENGKAVTRTEAGSSTIVVEIPEIGTGLFAAPHDSGPRGHAWSEVEATAVPPRELSLTASFERPGYYLAGTNLPELVGSDDSSSDDAVLIGIGAGVLVIVVLLFAVLLVRRRRRRGAA